MTVKRLTSSISVIFLIMIHDVLLLAYSIYGVQNALQMTFAVDTFFVLLCISSAYHLVVWLFTRKRTVRVAARIPLYFVPLAAFLLLSLAFPMQELPNQQPTLASPSRRYTMKMHMEHNRWIVSIFDKSGTKLYEDKNSEFVGHLNVYWLWDKKDRLWLYNSDDGRFYYWSPKPSGWSKALWDRETDRKKGELNPPRGVRPDYASNK